MPLPIPATFHNGLQLLVWYTRTVLYDARTVSFLSEPLDGTGRRRQNTAG